MARLDSFLPQDRRAALARGEGLPERAVGAALFADIAGFTPLAEALARELGPRRGAEELTARLNRVYGALIGAVERYGGSVVGFAGDAIVCWFADAEGQQPSASARAAACGLALHEALGPLAVAATPGGAQVALTLSVGVVTGVARRMLVGDPDSHLLDALAGRLLDRLVAAESRAGAGELLADEATVARLGAAATLDGWRDGQEGGERFARVVAVDLPAPPAPAAPPPDLPEELVRPWLPPPVYARLAAAGEPQAELRPATALMLRFGGPDYDEDAAAGATLDAFIRWAQAVIARYGGCLLDLTMGHSTSYLYAAFGAPAAHDDDSARAVATALELRAPPPALAAVSAIRIGIAQGQVRAGLIGGEGRRAYAALGDPANLAFRLMQSAPPGEIRCDEASARAAGRRWAFEPLPPLRLKGKAGLRAVLRPTGSPAAPSAGDAGPLVGRAAERGRLAGAVAEVAGGAFRLLVIEGEAGIGKSRLAAELLAEAEGRGLRTLAGAGQSIEQQTPYRAWREALAPWLGDAPAFASPDLAERLPLLNDILDLGLPATPLTASLEPRLRSESLGELVVALLRSRAAPQALILEDAHWLDGSSWALAARVARAFAAAGAPLLLALTLRPLDPADPGLAQLAALLALPGAERLSLGPLADSDVVALAAARLGVGPDALPPEAGALLRRRAGGNPLFGEELAAAMRDQGLLAVSAPPGEPPRCELRGDLDAAGDLLAGSLQGLLLARLDRLPPAERRALKVASVVGPVFPYGPARHAYAASAGDEPALKNHFRRAAALGFTWLESPEPELAYRFRHVLVREALYETMLFAERRALHRAVAAWYEGDAGGGPGPGDPRVPLLAHHFRHAEEPGRERHYARLAGIGAADRYANAEASAFFSRALELTGPGDAAGRYELLLAREQIHDRRGAREAQLADLAALEELAAAAAHAPWQAEVALRLASYHTVTGDQGAAVAAAERALALAGDDPARRVRAHLGWGKALRFLASYEPARRQLERAIELARAGGLAQAEAEALRQLGAVAYFQDDFAAARAYDEQALAIARAAGDMAAEAHALDALGSDASEQGDYGAAAGYYERAAALFRAVGDQWGLCANLGNLAFLQREQGNYGRALASCAEGLALARAIGDRRIEGWFLGCRGWVLLDLGAYGEADGAFAEGLAVCEAAANHSNAEWVRSGVALLRCLQGAYAEGEARARAVREAALDGRRSRVGDAAICLGHALAGQGRLAEAGAAYAEALAVWEELGRPARAVEARAGLADAALRAGDLAGALAQAGPILAQLAAGPPTGADEPLRVYWAAWRALAASADPRAGPLRAEALALLEARAALIADPALRHSYLDEVAAHRELRAHGPGPL